MMTRAQLTMTIVLIAALFAIPAYFSTMQLEHGKRHTHWEETR